MSWIAAALLAALCAGITSILAKCGMRDTDSDIATGIRTAVVLVFAWLVVFVTDAQAGIGNIAPLSWAFLIASGVATGASWLCYFKALSLGDVNKVVPVDKSSAAIAALLAIILFGETSSLAVKLISIVLITVGTYLMIEKKPKGNDTSVMQDTNAHGHGWLWYAIGAAVFAALTSILAKVGIEGVDSNLATAIRTFVVLVMAWGIVIARGKLKLACDVKRGELLFLVASGLATGASWLFFYYAIQVGQVSVVVQIDKLSIVVAVVFAWMFLRENLSLRDDGVPLGLFP